MTVAKEQVPAVDGWFTLDRDDPHLLGTRCASCSTTFFPAERLYCRNPRCDGDTLEDVQLSRRGTVWSMTTNHYPPPPPYVAPDPFVPYTVAAVELDDEKIVVLGQLETGVDPTTVKVGDPVELVLGTLFEDDEREHLVWRWRPIGS